jgi:ribosomal protein S18 acetylase RimI-like enzyme
MIRKAEKKDIDALVELIVNFEESIDLIYQGDFGELDINKDIIKKVLIQGFDDKYHTILVVQEKNELIGFGDVWIYPEFGHAGYSAYLHNFFIKKEFQNKGYGKKLLNELIEVAKVKKATAFHITTSFRNKKAIALYKKMGIDDEGLLLDKVLKYN